MQVIFQHHYQQKYLEISFKETALLKSAEDVMEWRQQWLGALSSWHSPYKAVIDCQNLKVDPDGDHKDIKDALERMDKILAGFFLKKAVIFGLDPDSHPLFPFPCAKDKAEAFVQAGIKQRAATTGDDFRSQISLQNHFRQHVIELTFETSVTIDSKEQMATLRSKLSNNLMQWHSSWSLLIDCVNLEISEDVKTEFDGMIRFFQGFFLKDVIGYRPKSKDLFYPFKVYRSRHNAAAKLESEGNFSGEDANCQSRK